MERSHVQPAGEYAFVAAELERVSVKLVDEPLVDRNDVPFACTWKIENLFERRPNERSPRSGASKNEYLKAIGKRL
jgi:hypothetical protein